MWTSHSQVILLITMWTSITQMILPITMLKLYNLIGNISDLIWTFQPQENLPFMGISYSHIYKTQCGHLGHVI